MSPEGPLWCRMWDPAARLDHRLGEAQGRRGLLVR